MNIWIRDHPNMKQEWFTLEGTFGHSDKELKFRTLTEKTCNLLSLQCSTLPLSLWKSRHCLCWGFGSLYDFQPPQYSTQNYQLCPLQFIKLTASGLNTSFLQNKNNVIKKEQNLYFNIIIITNYNKICDTVYEVHGNVHLWPYTKQVL
jgi:hypothetical protein